MTTKFVDVHCTIGEQQEVPLAVEDLIGIKDEHGITTTVLSPPHQYICVDNPIGNDIVLSCVKQYPDRFLGYAAVNPWYGHKAVAELDRALSAGLSGVKLHPALQGFFPFDRAKMDPLMEVAAHYRAPVYIHTGTPVFAQPLQVAELALCHPNISFIIGRMGNTDLWIDTPHAYAMADNLYADTPYTASRNISRLIEIDSSRVMFSADLPYSHAGLEKQKIERMGLDEQQWDNIAYRNFERLFGIANEGGSI